MKDQKLEEKAKAVRGKDWYACREVRSFRVRKFKGHKHTRDDARRRSTAKTRAAKFADELRDNPTEAETWLRNALTQESVMFDFQKPITVKGKFKIVDFYFPRGRKTPLVVEVDGMYHQEQIDADEQRTDWLMKNLGCVVLRFTNEEVLNAGVKVLDTIKAQSVLIQKQ